MFRKVLAITAICLAMTDATARAQFVLDVTDPGDPIAGVSASGDAFIVADQTIQPAGTGVFKPFLSIQRNGSEEGFNTDDTDVLDTKRLAGGGPGGWTTSVQVNELGRVTIDGTEYIQFVVDANQSGNAENDVISLNQVQLFVSEDPLGTGDFNFDESLPSSDSNAVIGFPDATEIFRLNNGELTAANFEILFDEDNGSGVADMSFFIESGVLTGVHPDSYLTLYMHYGTPPGSERSDAGFEEVAFLQATAVPEPASIVMSLTGAIPLGLWALRRRKQATA